MNAPAPSPPIRRLADAFLLATGAEPQRSRWLRERRHCRRLLTRLVAPGYGDSADRAWDEDWLLALWVDFLVAEWGLPFVAWHPPP